MSRAFWFRAAFIILVLGAALAWMFRARPEVRVSTARVTDGPMTRRVVATGSVQALTTVELGSQESGVVESLLADYNSFVRKGDIVARLDPSLYDAQYEAAQAALGQAEAALAQARANLLALHVAAGDAHTKLGRAQSLATLQMIARADLDAATIDADEADADQQAGVATVAQAEAGVTQAKGVVEQASLNVEHTIIRSPIDGIVIDREVSVGQTLAASMQSPVLFRIAADLTRMQVQVDVDESDVGALTEGESAAFDVESFPGETFHGTVSQVRLQPVTEQTPAAPPAGSNAATVSTAPVATIVSYTAIVDVANPDQRLRPGMTAEVVLSAAPREHVLRIPSNALSFRPPPDVLKAIGEREPALANGGDRRVREVWEYDGRRFTPIAVHAGLSDGVWTELLSGGVHTGDALVTSAVLK